jgi:hypothetical protein
VFGLVRHLAAHAAWAERAALAAERQEAALRAVVAAEAGDAVAEDAGVVLVRSPTATTAPAPSLAHASSDVVNVGAVRTVQVTAAAAAVVT